MKNSKLNFGLLIIVLTFGLIGCSNDDFDTEMQFESDEFEYQTNNFYIGDSVPAFTDPTKSSGND